VDLNFIKVAVFQLAVFQLAILALYSVDATLQMALDQRLNAQPSHAMACKSYYFSYIQMSLDDNLSKNFHFMHITQISGGQK